jgi:hypothetical protein
MSQAFPQQGRRTDNSQGELQIANFKLPIERPEGITPLPFTGEGLSGVALAKPDGPKGRVRVPLRNWVTSYCAGHPHPASLKLRRAGRA